MKDNLLLICCLLSCLVARGLKEGSFVPPPFRYREVKFKLSDSQKTRKAIVKENVALSSPSVDVSVLSEWAADGAAFPNSAEGIALLEKQERQTRIKRHRAERKRRPMAVDAFVPVKDEVTGSEVLVHAEAREEALYEGVQSLVERGQAFQNISLLLERQRILKRADRIPQLLDRHYPRHASQWKVWNNKTVEYGVATLTNILLEYHNQGYTIGDVGGKGKGYRPSPGYVGTLAPGEGFEEAFPIETLPNHIIHPWPAFQEFPFHIRAPVTHPMIPPAPLWIALNDMYTENYTATLLNQAATNERNVIRGGFQLRPRHAVQIAKFGEIGECYDLSEQLEHGGMLFHGIKIPNYNPDHGPTVPADEARPPIPEKLIPYTEPWLDPFFGIDGHSGFLELNQMATGEELREEELEDAWRARRNAVLRQNEEKPAWMRLQEEAEAQIENEVKQRVSSYLSRLPPRKQSDGEEEELDVESLLDEKIADSKEKNLIYMRSPGTAQESIELDSYEALTSRLVRKMANKVRKHIDHREERVAALAGRTRSKKQLVQYTIETMNYIKKEGQILDHNAIFAMRKSNKRRRKAMADIGDRLEEDPLVIAEEPADVIDASPYQDFMDMDMY
eukprot:scaffold5178_cov229-Ochromonas_danica.AAC.5